jgi:hypothetical protein
MTKLITPAVNGEFTLYDRSCPTGQWRNLRLARQQHQEKVPKSNWWLAWNGERLARNRDAGKLAEYHPAVYAWVIDSLVGEQARGKPEMSIALRDILSRSGARDRVTGHVFTHTCHVTRGTQMPLFHCRVTCHAMSHGKCHTGFRRCGRFLASEECVADLARVLVSPMSLTVPIIFPSGILPRSDPDEMRSYLRRRGGVPTSLCFCGPDLHLSQRCPSSLDIKRTSSQQQMLIACALSAQQAPAYDLGPHLQRTYVIGTQSCLGRCEAAARAASADLIDWILRG